MTENVTGRRVKKAAQIERRYKELVEELKNQRKKVIIMADNNSKKLEKAASCVIHI